MIFFNERRRKYRAIRNERSRQETSRQLSGKNESGRLTIHNHAHSDDNVSSRRIGWALFLNVGFTIIEFIGDWLTNSHHVHLSSLDGTNSVLTAPLTFKSPVDTLVHTKITTTG
ncbi:MAG: hypothetical protein ACJAZ7_001457 [Zhongshania aliphaticivorans]|jgi:hypothetical protein